MKIIKAANMERFQNFAVMVYSEPGKGKTTMVRGLRGRTLLLSTDGMFSVLSGMADLDILELDTDNPNVSMLEFFKFLNAHAADYQNIVVDNLSTFQKTWLNAKGRDTKNGTPELKDYAVIDRILFDTVMALKKYKRNVVVFAHERKVEVTREGGGVYTQFQPDLRNLDAIMGILPLVARLVVAKDKDSHPARTLVLQPTQATRAKDQLIGNLETIGQMELFKALQEEK